MSDWDVESSEPAGAWRLRPVILAAIGAVAAILVQQLIDRPFQEVIDRPYGFFRPSLEAWRIALSIAIGTGAMAFGFGMERVRLAWAGGFALLVGAVAGLIYYWNGGNNGWADFGDWRYASLFLSIAIAVPLFQTARDEGTWRFPYRDVHGHAWTNVVLWIACWAFVGIVFALAWLLAALFDLIGLHFVREMLERQWFAAVLTGAAFGGALGLFRERDRILRLLQRVVTAVLAVLAPVLGAGLLLFLLALPFTGLGALWQATKATTPILLSCAIGALILANAVIGNGEEDEATNPALRWGAMALGLAILPLCVIAAIATGLRIDQYGFTPDRLWALVFVILATIYGVAYLVSLALGRNAWAARVRPANLRMAFIIAGVALFLATPILSFNAISTADQVARLESGRTAPDKFDWAALAFDFGGPGKAALKRLAMSRTDTVRLAAKDAVEAKDRWEINGLEERRLARAAQRDALDLPIIVRPVPAEVPIALRRAVFGLDFNRTHSDPMQFRTQNLACDPALKVACQLFWRPGEEFAVAVQDGCAKLPPEKQIDTNHRCVVQLDTYRLVDGKWDSEPREPARHAAMTDAQARASLAADRAALDRGDVSVRTVTRRQLFLGDKPIGPLIE